MARKWMNCMVCHAALTIRLSCKDEVLNFVVLSFDALLEGAHHAVSRLNIGADVRVVKLK